MTKDEIMEKMAEVFGELITTGLNDLAADKQDVALRIARLMERDEVFFRISATMPMLSAKVEMAWHSNERAPVEIMRIEPGEKLRPN